MKKTAVFLALVMLLMLTVTACGKKPAADAGAAAGSQASANGAAAEQTNGKNDVTYGTEGGSVVFTVSPDFKLADPSAWLGVIPTGTKYEKEADADDVDLIYCYAANYEDEKKASYRFEFDKEYFFSVGDGTYDLVLNSSDDGEVGRVLLQIGIEIKGEKITLDYENKK